MEITRLLRYVITINTTPPVKWVDKHKIFTGTLENVEKSINHTIIAMVENQKLFGRPDADIKFEVYELISKGNNIPLQFCIGDRK